MPRLAGMPVGAGVRATKRVAGAAGRAIPVTWGHAAARHWLAGAEPTFSGIRRHGGIQAYGGASLPVEPPLHHRHSLMTYDSRLLLFRQTANVGLGSHCKRIIFLVF